MKKKISQKHDALSAAAFIAVILSLSLTGLSALQIPLETGWRFYRSLEPCRENDFTFDRMSAWLDGAVSGRPLARQPGVGHPFTQPGFNDTSWRVVGVPHDWGIEGAFGQGVGGYHKGFLDMTGVGWYRLRLDGAKLPRGRRVELRGMCLHQDLGALGSAWNRAAWKRRLLLLRRHRHLPARPRVRRLEEDPVASRGVLLDGFRLSRRSLRRAALPAEGLVRHAGGCGAAARGSGALRVHPRRGAHLRDGALRHGGLSARHLLSLPGEVA